MRDASLEAVLDAVGDKVPDLLRVEGLSTVFTTSLGPLTAVDDVSLQLTRGKTLGIVGESGSGKSVLVRSIMGLQPASATRRGSVNFEGCELLGLAPKQLRKLWGAKLAMVMQDPMTALNPTLRIGTQISESLKLHLNYSRTQRAETVAALLASVGISEPERRMRQYPHELSGGMRQRVVIAIALSCGPSLLFADEPTTALDVTVQAQILDLLASQQREREMAVLLISHDLGVVANRVEEVAVMYAGQIVEQAPTKSLLKSPRHPYTRALLRAIPQVESDTHTRLEAIPGRPPDLLQRPPGCRFAPRCEHVTDRCRNVMPTLDSAGEQHLVRCWHPQSVAVEAPKRIEVSS